jgi:hypothetical protein
MLRAGGVLYYVGRSGGPMLLDQLTNPNTLDDEMSAFSSPGNNAASSSSATLVDAISTENSSLPFPNFEGSSSEHVAMDGETIPGAPDVIQARRFVRNYFFYVDWMYPVVPYEQVSQIFEEVYRLPLGLAAEHPDGQLPPPPPVCEDHQRRFEDLPSVAVLFMVIALGALVSPPPPRSNDQDTTTNNNNSQTSASSPGSTVGASDPSDIETADRCYRIASLCLTRANFLRNTSVDACKVLHLMVVRCFRPFLVHIDVKLTSLLRLDLPQQ